MIAARHNSRPASIKRRLLKIETVLVILLAKVALAVLPCRFWMRFVSVGSPKKAGSTRQQAVARRARAIGRRVESAADRLPLNVTCLPRALAAKTLLARRGISSEMLVGAHREGVSGKVALHAWLTVNGHCVVGRTKDAVFRPFARRASTASVK